MMKVHKRIEWRQQEGIGDERVEGQRACEIVQGIKRRRYGNAIRHDPTNGTYRE